MNLRGRRGVALKMSLSEAEAGSKESSTATAAKEPEEDDPFIQELKEECVQEQQAAQKEKENYWEEQLNKVEQGEAPK